MEQIRKSALNKKMLIVEHLGICILAMVRSVDKRWSHLYPDILRLVQGLERLGLEYHNGVVSYAGLEVENV